MDFDHDTLVAFSKSWGLFYLIAFCHRRVASTRSGHRTGNGFDEAKTEHSRSGRRAMAVEELDPVSGRETTGTNGTASRNLTRRFRAAC